MGVSSSRKWLGSLTMAGLLLASSLPVSASSQFNATASPNPINPLLVASTSISAETYTQTVREQMQWSATTINTNVSVSVESASVPQITESTPSESVTLVDKSTQPTNVVEKKSQSSNVAQIAKKEQTVASNPKPVQVASEPKQQVSRSSNSSSTLVSNALSLKGVPYVYGGTSRSGFDCSGYTQYVFKGSGISLPRTSSAQFNAGTSVQKSELQTGDLVFFTTYAKGPSHVGIYVGGGNFIHASNSGVRVTSLNDGYYANRYVGARRVN